jgi:hypothetical protein
MKVLQYVLTLLLVLTWWAGFAQQTTVARFPLDAKTHRITYSEEVRVTGVSGQELTSRAVNWATTRSIPTKSPHLLTEHTTSTMVVAGTEELLYPTQDELVSLPLHYKATITLHEGGYHYLITDFEVETASPPSSSAHVYVPAETFLVQNPPANAKPNHAYLVYTALQEAIAQLIGAMQFDLASQGLPTQTKAVDSVK